MSSSKELISKIMKKNERHSKRYESDIANFLAEKPNFDFFSQNLEFHSVKRLLFSNFNNACLSLRPRTHISLKMRG